MEHKQVKISLENGQMISVDKGLESTIQLINSVVGLETYQSCIGNSYEGYILFGGERGSEFALYLMGEIWAEEEKWNSKHQHVCNGCMSLGLSLTVNSNSVYTKSICFRWGVWNKKLAFDVIARAVKNML